MPEEPAGAHGWEVGQMTEDVRKLLGGYATGTLSEEERKALYAAALSDDELFAALADEQALKDMLDDGAVRAQLLQATENPQFSVMGALREWFERPKSKALTATGAVLLVLIGARAVYDTKPIERGSSSSEVAELRRLPSAPEAPVANRSQSAEQQPARAKLQEREQPRETKPQSLREGDSAQGEIPLSPPPPPPPPKAEVAESVVVTRSSARGDVAGVGSAAPPMISAAPAAAPPPPPASLARRDFRTADEAARASSTAPAPAATQKAAAGPFERAAGTTAIPLRYELLRRDAAGAFQPVPIDHEFADGDVIRVRVNSTQTGTVVFGIAGRSSETGGAVANVWTNFPQTDGIVIGPETRTLVLRFTPLDSGISSFADAAATSQPRATPGAAAGGGVSIQIPLRRKAR